MGNETPCDYLNQNSWQFNWLWTRELQVRILQPQKFRIKKLESIYLHFLPLRSSQGSGFWRGHKPVWPRSVGAKRDPQEVIYCSELIAFYLTVLSIGKGYIYHQKCPSSTSFSDDDEEHEEHEETVEPRAIPVAPAPIVKIKLRRLDFMVFWFDTG